MIDPETLVGLCGNVEPRDDDGSFMHAFYGTCIGVRNGFLKVRDMAHDVYEIKVSQFTPDPDVVADKPHVVLVGDVTTGIEVYGPFPSMEAAADWGNTDPHLDNENWCMAEVLSPE